MYCYVPGCPNGNSASKEGKKSRPIVQIFFSAPEDEALFKAWQAAVPKSDHIFTRDDKLCEFHFQKSEVVLYIESKLPNGNVRRLPATEPKLKAGTIPSIFPQVESTSPITEEDRISESCPKSVRLEAEKPKVKRKSAVLDDSEKSHPVQQPERTRGRPRKNNSGLKSTPGVPEKKRKLTKVEPIVKKEKIVTDEYELESSSESDKQNLTAELDESGTSSSVETVPCTIRLVPLESLLENKPSKQTSVKSTVGSSAAKQRKRISNELDKDSDVLSSKKTKLSARKEYCSPNPYQRVYTSNIGITPTGRRIKKRLLDISDDPLSKELQLLMKGSQHRVRKVRKDIDEISSELEKIVHDFSDEKEDYRVDNYQQEISSGKSVGSNSVEDISNDYSENITDEIDESITIKSDPDEDQKDSLKELCAALEGNSSNDVPQSCEFGEISSLEKEHNEITNTVSPRKTHTEGGSSTWSSVCHSIPEDIQKLRDALTSDDEGRDEEVNNAKEINDAEKIPAPTVEKTEKRVEESGADNSDKEKAVEQEDACVKEKETPEEADPASLEEKEGEGISESCEKADLIISEKKQGEEVSDKPTGETTSEKKDGEQEIAPADPVISEKSDGMEVSEEAVPATSEKEIEDKQVTTEEASAEQREVVKEINDQDACQLAEEKELEKSNEIDKINEEENDAANDIGSKDVARETDENRGKNEDIDKEGPSGVAEQSESCKNVEAPIVEEFENIEDVHDEDANSDVIEKDVETPSCNEPRITQVISLSDALSEGDEHCEYIEENKIIEIDNYGAENEEDSDNENIAEGRQTPDPHEESVLKSTPDAEVFDISSDSDADPTWEPDAEAIEVSDANDTDPGSIDGDDDGKGSKETDDSPRKEKKVSSEKGNNSKDGKLIKDGKENEKKIGKKNDPIDSSPLKGKKSRPTQRRGRRKKEVISTTALVNTGGNQPVNILTSETIQEILKQIKLPLTTPVTLKIAPLVTSPEGKLMIDEKVLSSPTNLRKIAPRTGFTLESMTKINMEEYASKMMAPRMSKNSGTIISTEKSKHSQGLLGLKMFEGLGKIKKAFDFSTFLSDAEDEIQFRKFCLLIKECLNVVQESKNAKTNIGKLTINVTHKLVEHPSELTAMDSWNSQNSKSVNSENDEAEVFECMTVDSNVEDHFGHRSFNEKYKYAS